MNIQTGDTFRTEIRGEKCSYKIIGFRNDMFGDKLVVLECVEFGAPHESILAADFNGRIF